VPRTAKAIFPIPVSAAAFAASIEGLVKLNLHILRGDGKFPPLYDSGVVYKREPADVWRDIRTVYKSGWGDCEDLAAIRVAQLRFTGEDEQAHVAVYQSGARKYHAIVARSDGTTEDPSRRLGMLPGGRSPYGKLEGSDTMLDDNDMGHGDTEGDEFEGDDDVGRVKRRGWAARVARGRKKYAAIDKSPTARAKRRKHARALARWCAAKHVREAIGDEGAWVGMGDDPLEGDPNITFDLYKSGRGWSGIVRIPLDIVKAGRRQALIAKTSYTKPKKRRRRRRKKKRVKRRRVISRRRKRKRPTRRRRKGRAKRRTAGKAIRLASRIASLPGVQAFIPPQAKVALKILKSPIAKFATKKVGKFLSSIF